MTADAHLVFIGDIHGQYQALVRLLKKLGFSDTRQGWRHSQARAVFLGDLIDGGPQSREVVETIRQMVEHGNAVCIMGNHELNAIHYHTPDGQGGYLRPHTEKNNSQHESTLESFSHDQTGIVEATDWFRSLPVAIDWGCVRAVHATWSKTHLHEFEQRESQYLFRDEPSISRSAIKGESEHEAVEILLKGAEIRLPEGVRFLDKSGKQWRHEARLNWWQQNHPTWAEAISVPSEPEGLDMREKPDICEDFKSLLYPQDAPPVFFGHYWMSGDIKLQAENAFCADYSAGRGHMLCCYYWQGERTLTTENVISVRVSAAV